MAFSIRAGVEYPADEDPETVATHYRHPSLTQHGNQLGFTLEPLVDTHSTPEH